MTGGGVPTILQVEKLRYLEIKELPQDAQQQQSQNSHLDHVATELLVSCNTLPPPSCDPVTGQRVCLVGIIESLVR